MKSLSFKLAYTKYMKSGRREITIEKEIQIDRDTTFGDVAEWLDALKKAVAEAVRVRKSSNTYSFELVRSTYTGWHHSEDAPLVQRSYDRWTAYGEEQDEEGVHLNPDTRYTMEYWDLYLTPKTLMEDIKNL